MTRETDFTLTVLGARGSMACAETSLSLFGGDSSCYMVRAGEETIFLDAGTGLLHAPASFPKPPLILLSHLHLDHLVGLGMFPGISAVGQHPRVYVPFCESKEQAESILDRLYSPPFWPLRLGDLESRPALLPMPESLTQGEVRVESIPGRHPGGCLVFRLSYRGKRLVYATDFEHEEGAFDRLAAFAEGADLLLYDAQYTESEYLRCRGFGHSTAEKGLELWERCGAGRLLLVHHAPFATDERLLERAKSLPEGASYARQGQVVCL